MSVKGAGTGTSRSQNARRIPVGDQIPAFDVTGCKRRKTSKESDKESEPESLPVIPLDTESNWWDNVAQLDAE